MVLLAGCFTATAQQKEEYDSDYYESYTDQITGRVYFSQKYTNLILLYVFTICISYNCHASEYPEMDAGCGSMNS